MFNGQKIVVVMPVYNAARTYDKVMAQGIADHVIAVPVVIGHTSPCGT